MHVPAATRSQWYQAANATNRERLQTAVAAWYGAAGLGRDAFRARFLDPSTSDETVDRLRSAAKAMVEGRSYADLAKAGRDLAAAAQDVGAYKWSRFASDSSQKAVAAVSRGEVPGVIKASAADTPLEFGALVLGLLAILWATRQAGTSQPGGSSQAVPSPAPSTVTEAIPLPPATDGEPAPDQPQTSTGADTQPAKPDHGRLDLPANPDELSKEGWIETTNPTAAKTGRREFVNPKTGEEISFDKGRPGEPGFRGKDHYHRKNPTSAGKKDSNLDVNGNSVPGGSKRSHIIPGVQ